MEVEAHMASPVFDRGRFPPTLWRAMRSAGLEPSKVLRSAGLPSTLHLLPSAILSTAQLFAIWRAAETMTDDPGLPLRLLRAADHTGHQPAFIAALYASDFRDAIGRIDRFKRMGACEVFRTEQRGGLWSIIKEWPFATEAEPAVSVDLSFMFLLELGRRGTGRRITPERVEYCRSGPGSSELQEYFGAPIVFESPRNAMTFHREDLAAPFPGHSPEFLDLVTPGLAAAFAEIEESQEIADRVKAVLKRALASGRPDVARVAHDLGMSERTLQRRMTEEATTFRALLSEARRELSQQLLADPAIQMDEVTYLLGYQDTTSFYRAFKEWAGVPPGEWRAGALASGGPQALH
jgi:AraC-like DNA-binding protein